jgi:hypothetical protein
VKIAPREFEPSVEGVDCGCRYAPDQRLSGAIPVDKEPASGSRISQCVGVQTDDASSITTVHALLSKCGLQPVGDIFGSV